jgi:hypothetical protein
MKKLFILAVIVCLAAACMVPFDSLGGRSIYLSPPPDVLYDDAIIIVKEMGFIIINEHREQARDLMAGGWIYPNFKAENKNEISGDRTWVYLSFERRGTDTIVKIDISQQHLNVSKMEKLRDEIGTRLRAVQK